MYAGVTRRCETPITRRHEISAWMDFEEVWNIIVTSTLSMLIICWFISTVRII